MNGMRAGIRRRSSPRGHGSEHCAMQGSHANPAQPKGALATPLEHWALLGHPHPTLSAFIEGVVPSTQLARWVWLDTVLIVVTRGSLSKPHDQDLKNRLHIDEHMKSSGADVWMMSVLMSSISTFICRKAHMIEQRNAGESKQMRQRPRYRTGLELCKPLLSALKLVRTLNMKAVGDPVKYYGCTHCALVAIGEHISCAEPEGHPCGQPKLHSPLRSWTFMERFHRRSAVHGTGASWSISGDRGTLHPVASLLVPFTTQTHARPRTSNREIISEPARSF